MKPAEFYKLKRYLNEINDEMWETGNGVSDLSFCSAYIEIEDEKNISHYRYELADNAKDHLWDSIIRLRDTVNGMESYTWNDENRLEGMKEAYLSNDYECCELPDELYMSLTDEDFLEMGWGDVEKYVYTTLLKNPCFEPNPEYIHSEGSAYYDFLEYAKSRGWDYKTIDDIDPDRLDANVKRDIQIFLGSSDCPHADCEQIGEYWFKFKTDTLEFETTEKFYGTADDALAETYDYRWENKHHYGFMEVVDAIAHQFHAYLKEEKESREE